MRLFYGDKNALRLLDEMEFWKRQESEHVTVIKTVIPNLEEKFVKHLDNFELKFIKTEGEAVRFIETVVRNCGQVCQELHEDILCLIEYAMVESECFLKLIDDILKSSKAAKGDPIAKTVLQHIRRESEYFIGIAQIILYKCN